MKDHNIKYHLASFDNMKVLSTDEKGNITKMALGKEGFEAAPTKRFFTSITSNYGSLGLNMQLFNLFSHAEVFERMANKCTEGFGYTTYEDKGREYLLGVRKPGKAVARYDGVLEMLENNDGQDIKFDPISGTLTSWHSPQHVQDFEIGGDLMSPKFVTSVPIDGFGKPQIYLSMIRQICTNGMVGYGKSFRSDINLGRGDNDADVVHSVERHIDSYNNEEGFEAIQNRLNSAVNSWASVGEVAKIAKLLTNTPMVDPQVLPDRFQNLKVDPAFDNSAAYKVMKAFTQTTGDIQALYGLASTDALSEKRLSTMPAHCTMYELMNFTTEVATHFVPDPNYARKLQGQVGTFLSNEYDLEDTKNTYGDFADWHIADDDYAEDRQLLIAK